MTDTESEFSKSQPFVSRWLVWISRQNEREYLTSRTPEHGPAYGNSSNQQKSYREENEPVAEKAGKTEEISSVEISEAEEYPDNNCCSSDSYS